jgi:hypothetical protein
MRISPLFNMLNKHIALIVGLIVIATAFSGCTADPLASFQGPSYIPANYHNTKNNTTDTGKLFFYQGKGQLDFFAVAAAKDPNQEILKNITNSINNTPSTNVQTSNETLTIDGKQVTLNINTIKILGASVSTFVATWSSNSGLTIASAGTGTYK